MFKIMIITALTLVISGCAGIRYCNKEETPKSGCKAWDPASVSGAVAR